jgi:hypothetical protein
MSQEQIKLKELIDNYFVNSINFNINTNVNETDRRILNSHLSLNQFKNFKLQDIEDKLQSIYSDYIKMESFKPKEMHIHVTSDDSKSLTLHSNFKIHPFYLSPISYPYLRKPGSFIFKGNYLSYNLRNQVDSIIENELNTGVEYVHKYKKRSFFFGDILYLGDYNELNTYYKYSRSIRDVHRRQNNNLFRILFTHNFNVRPFIFRDRLVHDNINQFNLQYTHKIIKNYFDEDKCSAESVSNTPQEDSVHQIKAWYMCNDYLPDENENFTLKVSTNVTSSVNSLFIKNKLFMRKFIYFKWLTYQFNLEGTTLWNLKRDDLKVHEKLFVNFRGISNPSDKFDDNPNDSKGLMDYLMVSNKLMLPTLPLFNKFTLSNHGFQFAPYVHFNLLLAPGCKENLFYSGGLGLNFQTEAFNVEFNYTPILQKDKIDHGIEFSFNFGTD